MQRIVNELTSICVSETAGGRFYVMWGNYCVTACDDRTKAELCAAGLRRELGERLVRVTELGAHNLWHDVFVSALSGTAAAHGDMFDGSETVERARSIADRAVEQVSEAANYVERTHGEVRKDYSVPLAEGIVIKPGKGGQYDG